METDNGGDQGDKWQGLADCGACMKKFNYIRAPLLLPCLHAMCEDCVDKMDAEGALVCPECRAELPVSSSTQVRKQLAVDRTRLTALMLQEASKSRLKVTCEGCEGRGASGRCLQCQENLCPECCRAHALVKATKSHAIKPLHALNKMPELLVTSAEKCHLHGDRQASLYCRVCRVVLCGECSSMEHKDTDSHDVTYLKEVLDPERYKMRQLAQRLQQLQLNVSRKLQSLDSGLGTMSDLTEQVRSDLQSTFSDLIERILALQLSSLEQFQASVEADRQAMLRQRARLECLETAIQAASGFASRVASLGLSQDVFSGVGTIQGKLPELAQQSSELPIAWPAYKVYTANIKALDRELAVYGHVNREVHGTITTSQMMTVTPQTTDTSSSTGLPLTAPSQRAEQVAAEAAEATEETAEATAEAAADKTGEKAATTVALQFPVATLCVPGLEVTFPPMHLDTQSCGPGCVLKDNSIVQTSPAFYHGLFKSWAKVNFPGVSATAPLSSTDSMYWQAKVTVTPGDKVKKEVILSEVGVLPLDEPESPRRKGRLLSTVSSRAVTASLFRYGDHIRCGAWRGEDPLPGGASLCPAVFQDPIQRTLGFLSDVRRRRLHILDVEGCRALWNADLDVTSTLWPVVNVGSHSQTGARVKVTLETAWLLDLTPDLVSLMEELMKTPPPDTASLQQRLASSGRREP